VKERTDCEPKEWKARWQAVVEGVESSRRDVGVEPKLKRSARRRGRERANGTGSLLGLGLGVGCAWSNLRGGLAQDGLVSGERKFETANS